MDIIPPKAEYGLLRSEFQDSLTGQIIKKSRRIGRPTHSFLVFPKDYAIYEMEEYQFKNQRIYRDILKIKSASWGRYRRLMATYNPHWKWYQFWSGQTLIRMMIDVPNACLTAYHIWQMLCFMRATCGPWQHGITQEEYIQQNYEQWNYNRYHQLALQHQSFLWFLDPVPKPCSYGFTLFSSKEPQVIDENAA